MLNAGRHHRLEDGQCAGHVVCVVANRILYRIGDRERSREVHDGIDLPAAERLAQVFGVPDVPLDQVSGTAEGSLSGQTVARREVVVNENLVSGPGQFPDGVAADVAGAPGDEHGHQGRPIDR